MGIWINGSPALAKIDDPDTSHAAAKSLNTSLLENKVYEFILASGTSGCIGDEVFAGIPDHTWVALSPRFAPLIRKKLVFDTGLRRKGASGRPQRIMKATVFKGVPALKIS